jgi:hypothetical protein
VQLNTAAMRRNVTLSEAKGLCRFRRTAKGQRLRFFASLRMTKLLNLAAMMSFALGGGTVVNVIVELVGVVL